MEENVELGFGVSKEGILGKTGNVVEKESSVEDGLNRDSSKGKAVVDHEEVEDDGDSSEDEIPYDPTIHDEQSEDDIVVPENVGKVFKKNEKRGKDQVVQDDGGIMIEDSDNDDEGRIMFSMGDANEEEEEVE
ncbi:hypothetical protein L484_020921 [Morus notabilis]|uniref:Uncharacterized protein n=1 Tax=Morus notabilis TaxID=981085 RepID=W9QLG2_9ROSA|nr:hypothetical protein L484_020921 [Morus notabilis]